MNENEYINISKAFSSSLVEKADASIALNSFVPINKVAEAKDLKSNHSLRLEINKPESKYVAREVKVNGGTSYEILYSTLEPEIQQKLREGNLKSTALVSLNYQPTTFVSESARLLTYETAFYDKRNSGDVIFQFNNMADAACSGLLDNMSVFIQRFFSSISLVCVLFYNSWQLATIGLLVLACAFAPVAKLQKRIKGVLDKTVVADSAIITEYNEAFAGNKTITSYNLQKNEINKFSSILSNIFALRIKLVQRTQWLSPMMHVIVSVGIAGAIAYGSHLIMSNQITAGNFVSFITALILLYTPVKSIGNNLNQVQFSFFAIEQVFEKLDGQPAIKDKENAIPMNREHSKIEFKDVNFEYVENVPVLKNINLKINKGETIALVGNSGGGKTTIVNLLPRFYDIKNGSITINGIDIRNFTLHSLRQNIAVVFQDNFLFSGTIREYILSYFA